MCRPFWLLAALLLLLAVPRLWQLELDPPDTIVRGFVEQAQFRDEAAKGHEARNRAKWGTWSLSDRDEYGFWRAQSPAWVWGEYLWFRAFGVGLYQARMFVVVHSIVALVLLAWLAMLRRGLPTAIAAVLLLGLNWAYLVFSRLALIEGALVCWLLVATVGLSQLERRPQHAGRWAALATAAMLIACTMKQTGLLLVPAFAITLVLLGVRGGWARREAKITLLAASVLGVSLAILVLDPEYQRRLAFNADHFTGAQDEAALTRAAQTLTHALFGTRAGLAFVLAPVMLGLVIVDLARIAISSLRRGGKRDVGLDAIDRWMLAWLVLAIVANLASPHRAIRFHLILLPPAAWLAAVLIGRAWHHAWPWARAIRGGLVAVGVLGSVITTVRFVDFVRHGRASAATIGDELTAVIGPRDAIVVGEFAAQAVFETDYQHFYVRPTQFNDSAATIAALGITHLVAGDGDFVEARMRSVVPELLDGRRELGTVWFRGRPLVVWELAPRSRVD